MSHPTDELYAAIDTSVADQMSRAFEVAANRISPSVVPIFAEEERIIRSPFPDTFRDFFEDDLFRRFFGTPESGGEYPQQVRSRGSGVIVSEDGYILTNNHVIEAAQKITIVLEDK